MLPVIAKRAMNTLQNNNLFNTMDRLFEDVFSDALPAAILAGGQLDMYEDGEKLYVQADLPGYQREDLDLNLENNVLTIKAERKENNEEKNTNYFIRERRQQYWGRSLRLPVNVNPENIQAGYENGVLKIAMDKTDASKTRKIAIK